MNTIRQEYLNRLNEEFKNMSDTLIEQLELLSLQIKGNNDTNLFEKIKINEKSINKSEVIIREEIVNTIVLNSPKASDLRRIIAYFDMIGDMERAADLLYNTSKRMTELFEKDSLYELYQSDVTFLYEKANNMIQNAIFAFLREDQDIAKNVIASDDIVDKLHADLQKKMLSMTIPEKYPHMLADSLNIGRISYNIERVGDSATNIAEAVIFLTEGKDIKHNLY
ncbi:MAG: phosphate signaling complex protein PhoU [Bacteroidales bacterium]|jgi:phosphate transport system protein|nr:phosphate signaling complex protein PhoU [Paludibacteraceae bacterium]MBP8781381.1 phosphate signaling complex protein PhoU [Paludibacteraceae bacterium]MBP9648680.1 phosphate signaling complex protein PhoU [Paludibacteraceae bacterium]MBP9969950.1 phosphate signaling complex protein PhoU [Paludibacteraceae bacterium]NLK91563.1 phosphate signaling complex protein PhoU [Bacteroidales bacterium]